MTQTPVNIGSSANSGTGDTLRDAFAKLNNNDADHETRLNAMAAIIAATVQTPAAQKALLTAIAAGLPTTLPAQSGVLWLNGKAVQIS